jgi:Single-strand binding protein family
MNEITIVGNVTADPILRMSASGRGVACFDIAVNRRRFHRDINQYDDLPPVFHRVVAFGPVAPNAAAARRSVHDGVDEASRGESHAKAASRCPDRGPCTSSAGPARTPAQDHRHSAHRSCRTGRQPAD